MTGLIVIANFKVSQGKALLANISSSWIIKWIRPSKIAQTPSIY